MSNSVTTIELNGKRYDAKTGKLVGDSETAQPKPQTTAPATVKQNSGQIVDGFVRRPTPKPASTSQPLAKSQVSKTTPKPANRNLQKSKTLMRPAVKKPALAKTTPKASPQPSRSSYTRPVLQSTSRIQRSHAVNKSPHISKFGTTLSTISKKEGHLPVVTPNLAAIGKGVNNELKKLETALIDANSHLHELEGSAKKKVPLLNRVGFKNRAANLATLTAAFVLLAGFFAYQNSAAIAMRVAASRAGVSASMPGYSPAGYGVNGSVKSEAGKVSISFKSRTDDKGYTITQQASNWNSASLLANHVLANRCNTCFQTWQDQGKTIYIYDNSNATWVDGGIWYQIEGDAQLTPDQLLRLANSI